MRKVKVRYRIKGKHIGITFFVGEEGQTLANVGELTCSPEDAADISKAFYIGHKEVLISEEDWYKVRDVLNLKGWLEDMEPPDTPRDVLVRFAKMLHQGERVGVAEAVRRASDAGEFLGIDTAQLSLF